MLSTSRSTAISEAAEQVINIRDFAGSKSRENEVAKETLYENGITPSAEILNEVFNEVNTIWRQSQKNAGVDPKYFVS